MTKRMAAFSIMLCVALHGAYAGRFALLVGNSSAQGNYAPLRYVQNDLRSLKDILSGACGFEKQNIITLYNGSSQDLNKSVRMLAEAMAGSKDNLFLFYYSGHADMSSLRMGTESYPLDSLKRVLTNFPSDLRIGIFDACQSGSFTRIKGGRLDEPVLFKDDGKTRGQIILCSSSINENAQESDALGNSVFTFHFVNALRGSADLSNDHRITLAEAYQYAYNHTLSSTAGTPGGVQHPSYQFRIQGEGDIVLADLNSASQGILLGPEVQGDVTILNADHTVVADLTKGNGGVMIALGPGDYGIINGKGGRRLQARAVVAEKAVATVRPKDFTVINTGLGQRKGAEEHEPGVIQIGVTIGLDARSYDFTDLSTSLGGRFSQYGAFSMHPAFSFPGNYLPLSFALEGVLWGWLEGRLGFGGFHCYGQADYSGSQTVPATGASYKAMLHTDDTLSVSYYDLGIGYRFHRGYLKNVSLQAGFDFYSLSVKVRSIFSDSLYDIASSADVGSTTIKAVPYAAVAYTWPLWDWLNIGAKLRYRYQRTPTEFDNAAAETRGTAIPLKCNFGGMDGNVFINFHIQD